MLIFSFTTKSAEILTLFQFYSLLQQLDMKTLIRKAYNCLIFTPKYSQTTNSVTYPYKFGGIKPNTFQNTKMTSLFQEIFDRETLNGFKFAYIQVLKALKDKDQNYLKNIMEKGLISQANLIDTHLVHENEPVEVSVGRIFIAFGGAFQRNISNKKFVVMNPNQQNYFQLLMAPNLLTTAFKQKFSMLFGFEIYFNGKAKLLKSPDDRKANEIENHMIQFEISNQLNFLSLLPKMSKMSNIKASGISPEQLKQLFSTFMGNDYEWKIGDIDGLLNRNLETISGLS